MTSSRLKRDWAAAGACIGDGYRSIDHATGVDARTLEELLEAQADFSAWSQTRIVMNEVFETGEALIVRAVHSGNINGPWRGIETTGQRISFEACTIFKFDTDDHIVHEEMYYDMATVARQLGNVESP